MARNLSESKIDLADEGEVIFTHIGEQQKDGYFAEAIEFEVDVNGVGGRLTITLNDEADRTALMNGLVKLHKSLKSQKGKQELTLEDDGEGDEEN